MLSFKTSQKIHNQLMYNNIDCEYKYTNKGELVKTVAGHYYNDEYKTISEIEADIIFGLGIIQEGKIYTHKEMVKLCKQVDDRLYNLFKNGSY